MIGNESVFARLTWRVADWPFDHPVVGTERNLRNSCHSTPLQSVNGVTFVVVASVELAATIRGPKESIIRGAYDVKGSCNITACRCGVRTKAVAVTAHGIDVLLFCIS